MDPGRLRLIFSPRRSAVRLSDVKIEKGINIGSEIQVRCTGPLRELLEVLDETTQERFWNQHRVQDLRIVKLYNEIKDYMDEIDLFAERLDRYIHELERKGG